MRDFIAERFRTPGGGLSLNTEALQKYKDDIIDLSIGDTDIITDERIIDAAFADTKRGYTHYGNPKGDPELVTAIQKQWSEDFGIKVPKENILVTASSCLGMSIVMFSILNPGDEVIVFSPYFAMYKQQIELAGGVCIEVPCYAAENFDISEERLRSALSKKTKAIILNNPSNPTGKAYNRADLEMISKVAIEADLMLVSDEIYTTYMYEDEFVPVSSLPGMWERTITLNSFSKNFLMTGWRIGSVVASPNLINVMSRINGSLIYTAPSVSQRAGIKALEIREDIRKKYIEIYKDRVLYSAERIEKIPYLSLVRPGGTFYLFPGVEKTGLTSAQFCNELLERAHILVTTGSAFGEVGEGFFRIACTVSKDKLKEAFDRMDGLKF